MTDIVDLLNHHGSDKAHPHGYGVIYREMFEPLRHAATAILEVGVYRGASLRAWHDYFVNAEIVGVDHAPQIDCVLPPSRSVLVRASATDQGHMALVGKAHGPFDVVIDDGSHEPVEQRAAFAALMPFVKPGGYYLIEDARSLAIAQDLGAMSHGSVIDLRSVKGIPDDILVVFRKPGDSAR